MSEPQIVTIRGFIETTAEIIREMHRTSHPVFITSHGRFTAMLIPLKDGEVEKRVLAEMAREIADRTAGEEP